MPKRLTKDDATATPTYAKFFAEPFETGYGHTIGKSIAYGYVPAELLKGTRFEIETFGQRHPAQVSLRAPYDPERRKITA